MFSYFSDGFFLPCDHGLHFDVSLLCENSIQFILLQFNSFYFNSIQVKSRWTRKERETNQ